MKKRFSSIIKRRPQHKHECKCDKHGGGGIPLLLLRHELHENAHYRAIAGKHDAVVARSLLPPLLLRQGEEVVGEFKAAGGGGGPGAENEKHALNAEVGCTKE